MSNKWTDDQKSAINSRGGSLLVEAAAGSGKTAVLVERIIRRVVDEKVNINKFLVVTFTNMAAKEMKEKIIRAIATEISKNPKDFFLRDQLSLVHKAQITTVHSFCFNLIRENFTELKIAPDFKISADLDTIIAKKECMNAVVSTYFSEMNENFRNLVDTIGENNVESELLKIYNFIQSNANPLAYIDKVCENYDKVINYGFNHSIWYDIIWKKVGILLKECKVLSDEAVLQCDLDEVLSEKNAQLLNAENETILELLQAINDENWDLLHVLANNLSFPSWKSCAKSEAYDIVEFTKSLRKEYKSILLKIGELVYLPIKEINEQTVKLKGIILEIRSILQTFEIEYSNNKIKRNVLDFNDAEHKMVKLLCDLKTGKKTAIAHEISKKFTEIMVDEYQDTNEIQDILFKLLSNSEDNIFMVGDVKQSIYKFRLADPSIFMQKSADFIPISEALDGESRKVSLSMNFRSRDEILQATNFLFENIMSKDAGGVDYNGSQKLYLGAKYPDYERCKPEFCLVDFDKLKNFKTTTEAEACVIADKIIDLLDSNYQVLDKDTGCMRSANQSDIVILLRSKSTKANIYKKTLENAGINIDYKEGSEELFGTPEVSNLISLLKVLDNHFLDVELVAIMRSKIFDFSDEEIAKIRIYNPANSVFESVSQSLEPKTVDFLEKLDKIKRYSFDNSLFKTIWYVLNEFNLLARYAIMNNGAVRRNNILRFVDFLATFEDGFSIYDFVNFLEKVDNKQVSLPSGISNGYSVKIMTMHASKGLEFPIVFLADIAKEFNKTDLKTPIIAHNKLGIATKYTDDTNIVSYPSLMQKAIKMQIEDELCSEEMRILYVAMTRACEKLVVMCTLKKAPVIFEKWLVDRDVLNCNSYHYWFGKCITKLQSSNIFYKKFDLIDKICIDYSLSDVFDCVYIDKINSSEINVKKGVKYKVFDVVDFEYKHENSTKIPSKLTATDANNDDTAEISLEYVKKPKFLAERKLSATERGIAHHVVMQFMKFENCKNLDGVAKEILRLYEQKFITKMQYECINPWKIFAFINSDIGKRMLLSDEIIREFKFSVLSKAKKFYDVQTEDDVLLQGVIDCMFIENSKIIIIDYKTDYVTDENIDEISSGHREQLFIYCKAIEEIYGLEVAQTYLYYFKNESFYKL